MAKSILKDPSEKETAEDNNWRWWSLGVFLIGIFFLFVFEPPTDDITFQCDRATDRCTIKKSGFFRTKIIELKIEEIEYADFDPAASWTTRGYRGPDIKLQSGNRIPIGTSSSIFGHSREQEKVDNINNFLKKSELKQVSVSHKSFPTVIYAAIFLLGGIYSIYRGLKPYVIQSLNKKNK